METHRVMHDFGELSYEDLGEISRRSIAKIPEKSHYPVLVAAVTLGFLIAFLAKRKVARRRK